MKQPYLQIKKNKNKPSKKRPRISKDEENLSGFVQNSEAAEGEERFAKMLSKRKMNFWFELNPTGVPTGMPGWLTLDFLVKTRFGYRAFELDDLEFIHRGQREKADAADKDRRRLEGLNKDGYNILSIEHVDSGRLKTQDDTDKIGQELFG